MRLFSILKRAAAKMPAKTALIDGDGDKHFSYQELYERTLSLGEYYRSLGIGPGSRVALVMVNSLDLFSSLFSLLRLGAVPLMIDHSSTAAEIAEMMELGGSEIVISGAREQEELFGSFEKRVILPPQPAHSPPARELEVEGGQGYGELIFFSYRGLGRPLPALFSEQAMVYSILSNIYLTEVNSSLRISLLLPISHIFAFTCGFLTPLFVGGTIIINNTTVPRRLITLYNRYEVNFFITVPALLKLLIHSLRRDGLKLESFKRGIVGGDYCPPELSAEWEELTGSELVSGYGLTECCPVICNRWKENRPASIGKAMYGAELKIVDEEGAGCPPGEQGRLLVKSKTMMKGYYNMPELSSALLKEGWFDTGDLAGTDNEDFFYFISRDKAIAKIGGATVDLEEIRRVLLEHPAIDEAELKLESDRLWGEKIVAYLKGKEHFDKLTIYDYCRSRLASHKIPKSVVNL